MNFDNLTITMKSEKGDRKIDLKKTNSIEVVKEKLIIHGLDIKGHSFLFFSNNNLYFEPIEKEIYTRVVTDGIGQNVDFTVEGRDGWQMNDFFESVEINYVEEIW